MSSSCLVLTTSGLSLLDWKTSLLSDVFLCRSGDLDLDAGGTPKASTDKGEADTVPEASYVWTRYPNLSISCSLSVRMSSRGCPGFPEMGTTGTTSEFDEE